MVNYQKYMFDDFIVRDENDEDVLVEDEQSLEVISEEVFENEETIHEETENDIEAEEAVEQEEQSVEGFQNIETLSQHEEISSDFQLYNYVKETETIENVITYTEDEMKEMLRQAEETAYNRGVEDIKNSIEEKQNILLEDIKNQLMTIFASLDEKKSSLETSALKFAVSVIEKILPTIEKERAEKEIKNFLSENFANFSSQEALSFSFHPDVLSHVSGSIRRLAEQNDFEGKISVHKDPTLGLSDCRVEWKSGGVERKASSIMDKVKKLIKFDNQERENGE